MKKIFTLFCIALLSTLSFGQITATSGGPDSYGYSFLTSANGSGPAYSWIDITSTGTNITSGLGDDNYVGPFNVGFSFPYYWTNTTSFYIGSNGYITFQNPYTISSSTNPAFPSMPTTGGADNFIAPLLADLIFGASGSSAQVYYYSNNIDTLIVSFINVPFWNSGTSFAGSNTFQVIMCAADSSITFQYQNQSGSWDAAYNGDPGANSIGIESIGSLSGLTVAQAELPTNNFAIRFDLNVNSSFSLTDLSANWNDNSKNGGFFLSQQYPHGITAGISNDGTTDVTTAFSVSSTVVEESSSNNATIYNTSVSSLNAGQSVTVAHSPALLLQNFNCGGSCNSGTYTINTSIGYTDNNSLNDNITTEMVVLDESNITSVEYTYVDGTSEAAFGFEGGAVYIEPAYYPADLNEVMFQMISAAGPTTGFIAEVFDDNGANGAPGTLLFVQNVSSGSVIYNTAPGNGNWHAVPLSTPITVDSGGIYISWRVQTAGTLDLNLAEDQTAPFSNRNYEVLSGSFGDYRSNDLADLMIKGNFDMNAGGCIQNFYESDQLCSGDSIIFGSQVIKNAGVYYHSYSLSNCDSFVELTVSMLPSTTTNVMDYMCTGGTYIFNTDTLTGPGVYNTNFDNAASNGCDSIVNLTLITVSVDATVTQNGSTLSAQTAGATFQWFDCNTNQDVPGATSASFTASVTGTYGVRVTKNGCTVTSACTSVTGTGGTGIGEIQKLISVHPNPANSYLIISSQNLLGEKIILMNALGETVKEQLIDSQKVTVALEDIEEGMYWLRAGSTITKVIVLH